MDPLSPKHLLTLVHDWVVPLFLLFNIVGWVGLPSREVNRSGQKPYLEEDVRALGKATWAAWVAGVVFAVALLWAVFAPQPDLATTTTAQAPGIYIAVCGFIGFVFGLARGVLPTRGKFREAPRSRQRRILACLVFAAVTVSVTLGVLYYTAGDRLSNLIASGYIFMLAGYAISLGYQAAK